jgi:hypothetical protein
MVITVAVTTGTGTLGLINLQQQLPQEFTN